jgi:hypothetical protein
MTAVFVRDGFIDRYRGGRLVFPAALRLLSRYLPRAFPFQRHWKMSACHIAYWELCATIDHVVPKALGGTDSETNWVSCSMLTNNIKANWTLEELQWQLQPAGQIGEWDGLLGWFIRQVANDQAVLQDPYIKRWHNAAGRVGAEGLATADGYPVAELPATQQGRDTCDAAADQPVASKNRRGSAGT